MVGGMTEFNNQEKGVCSWNITMCLYNTGLAPECRARWNLATRQSECNVRELGRDRGDQIPYDTQLSNQNRIPVWDLAGQVYRKEVQKDTIQGKIKACTSLLNKMHN